MSDLVAGELSAKQLRQFNNTLMHMEHGTPYNKPLVAYHPRCGKTVVKNLLMNFYKGRVITLKEIEEQFPSDTVILTDIVYENGKPVSGRILSIVENETDIDKVLEENL